VGFNFSAVPALLLTFPNLVSSPLLYPKTLKDRMVRVFRVIHEGTEETDS
jgi:hypothetical protein